MSFDFDAAVSAPFRMQPGLRRLEPGAVQLTPAQPGQPHQREKLAVLSAFKTQALLAREGFDTTPALAALAAHAAAEHPAVLRWDGRRAEAPALGVGVEAGQVHESGAGSFGLGDEIGRCLRQLAPEWRLAGLLSLAFAEDFAIVDASDGTIPWLAVALPSHWAPETKVGRHFAEIHAPVADNTLLLAASERLTTLVTGPQRWERFVWTVTGHPRLHAHPARCDPARWPAGVDAASIGGVAWWRCERQTFIPVPGRRQAVFTILVDVQPLAQAIAPGDQARRLHDAIESMSPAVLDYRGLGAVRAALLGWLAARALDTA
ncbi:MAG TPA: heme-dependent oxidative N-demethylase subunit alpha family protein [Rubrivivax sp.]